MATLLGVSIDLVSVLTNGWTLGPTLCYVTGFEHTLDGETEGCIVAIQVRSSSTHSLGMASVFTLVALAIGRWAIVDFSHHLQLMDRKHFKLGLSAVASVWIMALALALPPILGWGDYVPDKSGIR